MAMTPKAKAFTFAAGLLLVSTIMVGTSIAATGSALRPFASGQGFAGERGLTRGHHVALAISVGQSSGEAIQPLSDALVTIARPGNASDAVIATQKTDDKGLVIFELKPGEYVISVSSGDLNTTERHVVSHDEHVAVFFDENGQAQWKARDHKEIERGGKDESGLMVRVMENVSGERQPAENASVWVYSLAKDGSRELVKEGTTGPRGFVAFQLQPGMYIVNVTLGAVSAEHQVPLKHPLAIGVLFDHGSVDWRAAPPPRGDHGGHGQGGRSGEGPSRSGDEPRGKPSD